MQHKIKQTKKQLFPVIIVIIFTRVIIPLLFLIISILSTFIFISYSPLDPSWNSVPENIKEINSTYNLLGINGAYIADITWQLFGYVSYIISLLNFLWAILWLRVPIIEQAGWKYYVIYLCLVIIYSLSCLILMATLVSFFSAGQLFAGWIGIGLVELINITFNKPWNIIIFIILIILCVVLFVSAVRLPLHDYITVLYLLGKILWYLLLIMWYCFNYASRSIVSCFLIGRNIDNKSIKLIYTENSITKSNKSFYLNHVFSKIRIEPSLNSTDISLSSSCITNRTEVQTKSTTSNSIPLVKMQGNKTTALSCEEFQLPHIDLLNNVPDNCTDNSSSNKELQTNAHQLEEVLSDFNIKGNIRQIHPGPVITMYELEPAPGIKTTRIINLSEDIARNMRVSSVRIATVSGKSTLGIELPNIKRSIVNMKEILSGNNYQNSQAKIPIILGKKIDGTPFIADLAAMPHLLIAGTTGSGKSVGLNVMLLSILYKLNPDQCRIIMIDPKMLELSVYDGIPHLLTPVIIEPKQAIILLKWTVNEMENRYRLMSKVGVRNIDGYNQRIEDAKRCNKPIIRKVHTGFDPETNEAVYDTEELSCDPLPIIVVVVDEMADLMIVAGKEIEASIQRLAQMARAAGIHLIMATQRPSVDVVTGTIKANFPTRISYRVTSKIDSRTIIDEVGAEQLLGKGDLLLMQTAGHITRLHAPFIEDHEIDRVCNWLRAQCLPKYLAKVIDKSLIMKESEENILS